MRPAITTTFLLGIAVIATTSAVEAQYIPNGPRVPGGGSTTWNPPWVNDQRDARWGQRYGIDLANGGVEFLAEARTESSNLLGIPNYHYRRNSALARFDADVRLFHHRISLVEIEAFAESRRGHVWQFVNPPLYRPDSRTTLAEVSFLLGNGQFAPFHSWAHSGPVEEGFSINRELFDQRVTVLVGPFPITLRSQLRCGAAFALRANAEMDAAQSCTAGGGVTVDATGSASEGLGIPGASIGFIQDVHFGARGADLNIHASLDDRGGELVVFLDPVRLYLRGYAEFAFWTAYHTFFSWSSPRIQFTLPLF